MAGASADAYEVVPDAYSAMIGLSSSLPSRLELPLREGLDGALAPIEGASSPTPEPDPDPTTNPEEPPDATTGPDVWTPDAGPPTPIDDVGPNVEVASADGVGDALEDVGASSGGGGGGDGCGGGPGPGPMPLAWTVLALMLWRASRRS